MNSIVNRSLFTLAFVAVAWPALAAPLTVQSSDTLLDLSRNWADGFMGKQTTTKVALSSAATPAVFAALAERKINLATTSRTIRYKEAQACQAVFGQRPTDFKVAVNGVAVYVHPDNPVKVLMYEELEGIYRGKFRNWKQLGGPDAPITILGVATNTSVGELFVEEVLGGKPVTNDVQIVTQQDVLRAVAQNANAIGFGAYTRTNPVRCLQIKRVYSSTPVEPDETTIANRVYPITRFIYCYVEPEANQGEIKSYLDWIRSDEGQQIAVQAGYYVLPTKWRQSP